MTEEYIKRSGAILAIQKYGVGSFDFEEDGWTPEQAERFVISALKKLPSEDVAPVRRGKWEDGDVDGIGACGIEYRYKKCSICDYKYSFLIKYNFCPNCGADMREANDGI